MFAQNVITHSILHSNILLLYTILYTAIVCYAWSRDKHPEERCQYSPIYFNNNMSCMLFAPTHIFKVCPEFHCKFSYDIPRDCIIIAHHKLHHLSFGFIVINEKKTNASLECHSADSTYYIWA